MRVSLNGNRYDQQQEEKNAETTHVLNVTCPRLLRKLYIQGPAAPIASLPWMDPGHTGSLRPCLFHRSGLEPFRQGYKWPIKHILEP